MAIVIPSLLKIKSGLTPPTDSNLYLLERLEKGLPSDFKVYYKPILQGHYPDIVVYKDGYGILIIKTIENSIDENNHDISSYISDMLKVRRGFANHNEFYSEKLMKYNLYKSASKYNDSVKENLSLANPNSIIKLALYFHENEHNFIKRVRENKVDIYDVILWSSRDLRIVNDIINKLKIRNLYFQDTISSLEIQLNPSIEKIELGQRIIFNERQEKLSKIFYPENKKVSGAAGSGKSLVLAQKAINAYYATKEKVLILCFNITLVNYIRHQIQRLLAENIEDKFYITHYHDFMRKILDKYGIKPLDEYDSLNFISSIKKLQDYELKADDQYRTILIDEGQDFLYEWFEFLKNRVLMDKGSYTIFGDSKQNIYKIDQEVDDNNKKNIRTNVIGRWNELKESYRFGRNIKNLSTLYQEKFLEDYNILEEYYMNIENDLLSNQDYVYISNMKLDKELSMGKTLKSYTFEKIKSAILFLSKEHKLNQNDITILGCDIIADIGLVELEAYLRLSNERFITTTAFETKEEQEECIELIDKIINDVNYKYIKSLDIPYSQKIDLYKRKTSHIDIISQLQREMIQYRQRKKRLFKPFSDSIKLSSVHSFKGWESHCVILVITDATEQADMKELVYVGITRAKEILYIINTKPEFSEFFQEFAQNNPFVKIME